MCVLYVYVYLGYLGEVPRLPNQHNRDNCPTKHQRNTSFNSRKPHTITQTNKIINQPASPINKDEQTLLRKTRHTLPQLRTNKSPFLKSYLYKIDPQKSPIP